jgi:hypothetical protein
MDIQKARRFILKIQTLMDQESQQELSRLEKDLLKSYVMQLYEAIMEEKEPVVKPNEISYKTEMPKPQVMQVTEPKVETPTVNIPEIKPQPPKVTPVEIHYTPPEVKVSPPVTEYKPVHIPEIEVKKEPVHTPATEVKKEPVQQVHHQPEKPIGNADESLAKLFDFQTHDDVADRFSQVPISDIQSAMGLNERIFTLKELFGGDKTLFDATCEQLNNLHSFPEAQMLLVSGPARVFKWGEAERLKMAEQFIRIVARRYPKHGH